MFITYFFSFFFPCFKIIVCALNLHPLRARAHTHTHTHHKPSCDSVRLARPNKDSVTVTHELSHTNECNCHLTRKVG